MAESLMMWSDNPLLLAMGIVLLSYALEDAAIVSAALLSVDGSLPFLAGLVAITFGIASGDLGLYYLGRFSNRIRWTQKPLASPKADMLRRKLSKRVMLNVFCIRFIPGLRSVGYLACGALGIHLGKFLIAVTMATVIWCVLVYSSIYWLGDILWLTESPLKWILAPLLLMIMIMANKTANRRITQDTLM